MAKEKTALSFNPKEITKNILSALPEKGRDVLISRFGLGKDTEKKTLESIGKKYKITRERVRQIESYSIKSLRKSKEFQKEKEAFNELHDLFKKMGSIVRESDFLNHISKDKSYQNSVHFLITIHENFKKEKEDEEFHNRWHIDQDLSKKIHDALRKLYENLSNEEILPESKMVNKFLGHLKDVSAEYKEEEILRRWLSLSKKIGKNPLGEWGRAHSPNIRTKGIKNYAYLLMRRHGSPIHFREVARLIEEVFKKKAHVATTHNELIKDPRFVLVGRGLYALREWGYKEGVVKDVIKNLLEKEGPLTKEEIVEKVLKERYVKENTILVNLQNPQYFKKEKTGKYTIA